MSYNIDSQTKLRGLAAQRQVLLNRIKEGEILGSPREPSQSEKRILDDLANEIMTMHVCLTCGIDKINGDKCPACIALTNPFPPGAFGDYNWAIKFLKENNVKTVNDFKEWIGNCDIPISHQHKHFICGLWESYEVSVEGRKP